ncbi:MAG: DUF1476 family protein [Pseudomonadota bacterium]|nr:DUF1476 family protein [Pseudomonadota bacterium]
MDSLTRREEGFERAYAHQEDVRFRARARRNRKLGRWAGEARGLVGPALADYEAAFVARSLEAGDDEALVAELVAALPDISEHRIRRRLDEFAQEAMAEIQAGR